MFDLAEGDSIRFGESENKYHRLGERMVPKDDVMNNAMAPNFCCKDFYIAFVYK